MTFKDLPLVSFIMSVHNSSNTVRKSIDSMLAQKYKNIEILIMDDGSSDNTYEIIKSYEANSKIVKIFKNSKNIGLTKSLNKLINLSTGRFIARQDSDDLSDVSRIEKQLNAIEEYNLDFCSSRAINISTNEIIPRYSNYLPKKMLIKYKNPFIHGTLLIKKDVIQEIGNYDERFYYSQDYKLMKDLLEKRYRYKVLNEALYFLNTENNISNIFKKEQEYYANCVKSSISPDHEYLEKI